MATAQSTGVFLNGKAQVIEMLQFMTPAERDTLIKNIRIKNPALANELTEESLTFDSIAKLGDEDLEHIFQYISAPILGVALKNVNPRFQRRLLSIAPRSYAEEAYQIMVTNFPNEARDAKRAQTKILRLLVTLHKRRLIQL